MYLLIDPSESEQTTFMFIPHLPRGSNTAPAGVKFFDETSLEACSASTAGSLLSAIIDQLEHDQRQVADIKGIAVRMGRGRFTPVRVAATVANTLAYTLDVPVVGVQEWSLERAAQALSAAPERCYVSAAYSGPPRLFGV